MSVKDCPGDLWELVPWFQIAWEAEEVTYLLIKRVGRTSTWQALCIETARPFFLEINSSIYQRVV
jgi:hypothetical protein